MPVRSRARAFFARQVDVAVNTSAAVEWAWIVGRVAVVVAVFLGAAIFLRGTGADLWVYAGGAAALTYDAALSFYLKRGHVRETFLIGFALDNAVTMLGWWGVASSLAGAQQTNDLYLMLFPKLMIGVVRLGWFFGAIYTIFWISWISGVNYVYYGPGSYDVEQLPLRVIFIVGTALLTHRLVVKLNVERRKAELLRSETSAIAEIGKLVGSTLDHSQVFEHFVEQAKRLIPFELVILGKVNRSDRTLEVTHASATGTGEWLPGSIVRFTRPFTDAVLDLKKGLHLRDGGCALVRPQTGAPHNHETTSVEAGCKMQSLIIAPVLENGEVVAVLIAGCAKPDELSGNHLDLLMRIGAHISGALANAQLYERTLQLAEERDARVRLDGQNAELFRISQAKSHLLSSVSHELKTPLTSLIAFNELLLRNRQGNLNEGQLKHLNIMRRNAMRLNGLIGDLLDMSRIEGRSLRLERTALDPHGVLEEVALTFGPILADKLQKLNIQAHGELEVVSADRDRLAQIMTNLVSNASKYSPTGSTIDVAAESEGGRLMIAVADRGVGISEADLARLFTPFFRSSDAAKRSQPGTGLGLVITKGIIEAHGGEISVESTLGIGTTVRFWIPNIATSSTDAPTETLADRKAA